MLHGLPACKSNHGTSVWCISITWHHTWQSARRISRFMLGHVLATCFQDRIINIFIVSGYWYDTLILKLNTNSSTFKLMQSPITLGLWVRATSVCLCSKMPAFSLGAWLVYPILQLNLSQECEHVEGVWTCHKCRMWTCHMNENEVQLDIVPN